MRKTQSYSKHFLTFKHRLADYHRQAKREFDTTHPQAAAWLKQRSLNLGQIRHHSHRLLTGATLSSLLLLTSPPPSPQLPLAPAYLTSTPDMTSRLRSALKSLLPARIGHLDPANQTQISQAIATILGLKATVELDGQKLNHSLGFIGFEQHLRRFPQDTLRLHDEYPEAGLAPSLGAWGYLADSSAHLTPELELIEKYYAVVQTLYLPTWQKDLKFLRDWYKYRKVLIINVDTGAAVVAAIADAGPASWTGKQFGGSPEVMHHLGLGSGPKKGKVLLLFVDDPQNQVPLGPVKAPLSISPPQII